MGAYFTAQLDLQRVSADGGCFRSEVEGECFDAGVELEEGHYDKLSVEVCRFCKRPRLVEMPPHLGEAASVAARLSRLKEGGARFAYPESLTPLEWACVDALQQGLSNDNEAARRSEKEKISTEKQKAELQALVDR